jgi:N-acyl-phosphatidylethanolamine-hydrolysing phospholipase D
VSARAAVAAVLIAAGAVMAGAPRLDDRFVNAAGPRPRPGAVTMGAFLLRKAWTSLVPRGRGAPTVPFDPVAIAHNPSVTWIGHATFLVRMDGVTFLTDPIFSTRASPVAFAGPGRRQPPGVPLDRLPPVDFVLVSHDHYDHADVPSLAALAARGAPFIVPLGLGDVVREAGGTAVELDWWESAPVADVTVHCVPAQHFSGRSLTDEGRRLWAGFVVRGPTRTFFHAGDTGYHAGFGEVRARLGAPDVAALPIGAYDPPAIMQAVHMNPEEAVRAAGDLGARVALAMHWGTFDLTDEPLDEPPVRFQRAAAAAGRDAGSAWTLAIGETRRW